MYKWRLGLGDSSDSVTIVIVTVTITTEIAIVTVDMWLQACVFDVVSPQHTHNYIKKHAKITMNIFNEINLDKVFSVGGLKEWDMEVLGFSATNVHVKYSDFVSKF